MSSGSISQQQQQQDWPSERQLGTDGDWGTSPWGTGRETQAVIWELHSLWGCEDAISVQFEIETEQYEATKADWSWAAPQSHPIEWDVNNLVHFQGSTVGDAVRAGWRRFRDSKGLSFQTSWRIKKGLVVIGADWKWIVPSTIAGLYQNKVSIQCLIMYLLQWTVFLYLNDSVDYWHIKKLLCCHALIVESCHLISLQSH